MIKLPQLPQANWGVTVPWDGLNAHLDRWQQIYGLVLQPDYQRAHVWTLAQKIAYIEWVLMGGESGKTLHWNSKNWQRRNECNPIELIDGLQRLTAVQEFLAEQFRVFGYTAAQISDTGEFRENGNFLFKMCSLDTRIEVLKMYLVINTGGTPHTKREIARVQKLLDAEIADAIAFQDKKDYNTLT